MKIERLDEARLTRADEREIAALLELAFPEPPGFGGRSFYVQRHHVRLLVRDGGLIGHLAVQMRAIRLGGRLCTIGGFAEVCTRPDRRGEGIASALVRAGIAEVRAMPCDFAVLFGVEPLYARAGFVAMPNPLVWCDLDEVETRGIVRDRTRESLMVLPVGDLAWDEAATVDLVGGLF